VSFNLADIKARLADPLAVASLLGLAGIRRQAGGCVVLCPAHDEKAPSCSLTVAKSGELRARCFSCGWSGDVLGLVAAVRGLSTRSDFAAVVKEAAELAGVEPERRASPRMSAPPVPPIVVLAHRIDAAAHDFLADRLRPDETIERASEADILAALALLEERDARERALAEERDGWLDALADAYEGTDERRLDEANRLERGAA
jgi:hypothetical protein